MGPLTEYFRTAVATWRTPTPVFSFAGIGPVPDVEQQLEVDPFGLNSGFERLEQEDGVVLFYGADLTAATVIHYVERKAGGPLYRYDKLFPGKVVTTDRSEREVTLRYHVRPQTKRLEYDWPRLSKELRDSGIYRSWESGLSRLSCVTARQLVSFWVKQLKTDPLYLLDSASRSWVEPLLHNLGRRFELEDFESEVSTPLGR